MKIHKKENDFHYTRKLNIDTIKLYFLEVKNSLTPKQLMTQSEAGPLSNTREIRKAGKGETLSTYTLEKNNVQTKKTSLHKNDISPSIKNRNTIYIFPVRVALL